MSTKRDLREMVEDMADRLEFCEATIGQLQWRVKELEVGYRLDFDIPEMLTATMTTTEDNETTIYQFPAVKPGEADVYPWKPRR